MTEQPTILRLSRQVAEDHQQIDFFLGQIMGALHALDPDSRDVEPLRRLAAEIDSFRERLEEHFAREEREGLFQAVQDALPGATAAIHQLGSEHERLAGILQMARIHAQRGEPCEIGPLRADLDRFLEMIREHERKEEALLARALEEEARSAS